MKLLSAIFALISAGPSWTVHHAPTSVKMSQNSRPNGQEVFVIHKMVSGSQPSHALNSPVLSEFDIFNPIEKSVILIVPSIPKSENVFDLTSPLTQPTIELGFKGDAAAVVENSNENVLMLSTDSGVEDVINELMDSLSEKYGNNFILSLVSNGLSLDESSVGRQTLQADDTGASDVTGSTKPRSQEFPVFFIIIATFTVLMLFILLFISYEMAYMGPGDNIAYKLGAAASKKNQ